MAQLRWTRDEARKGSNYVFNGWSIWDGVKMNGLFEAWQSVSVNLLLAKEDNGIVVIPFETPSPASALYGSPIFLTQFAMADKQRSIESMFFEQDGTAEVNFVREANDTYRGMRRDSKGNWTYLP